ncbi:MAG: hypothetical protein ACI9LM_001925 [Alteromonadaceae bacterium]|jgi:hypothetical protein
MNNAKFIAFKQISKILTVLLGIISTAGVTSEWSKTELFYQQGKLLTPSFAGGGKYATTVITLQHASGWKYGDNFFFVDHLNDGNSDGFDDSDFYGEIYLHLSASKIFNTTMPSHLIKDVGVVFGINADADANVMKYLPGVRISWDIPGFTFLNSDITAYIDDNDGLRAGTANAPSEKDSFMVDISFGYPFSIGEYDFSIEGHMEYINERKNELGDTVHSWFLAQPQVRFDIGKALANNPDTVFAGIKWQYWQNKLGDNTTDENVIMALLVWRL